MDLAYAQEILKKGIVLRNNLEKYPSARRGSALGASPTAGASGGFGGHIVDTLQNEQDYFVCGGSTLKTLRFQLITSTGQIVNLNGADWSFSIIFQDMA